MEDKEIFKESRKQITFDLSQMALRKYYPPPKDAIGSQYYKKAYADISRFMEINGFIHRQYSVYISKNEMSSTKVTAMIRLLAKKLPWFSQCVNQIDVTDIGMQHSLLNTLKKATRDVQRATQKKEAAKKPSIHEKLMKAKDKTNQLNQERQHELVPKKSKEIPER